MRFFIVSVTIIIVECEIINACDRGELSERSRLLAVTRFKDLNKFYLGLQSQNTESLKKSVDLRLMQEHPYKDLNTKEDLCYNIFRSAHFDIPRADEEQYFSETRKCESTAYLCQFLQKWLPPWGKSKRKNPYIFRKVNVDQTCVSEYMFKCLAKDRFKEPIERYLISTAYNVNKDKDEEEIAGRFIFIRDVKKELVLFALAEEAASTFVSASQHVEIFYLEKRERTKPTEHPEDDPICKLSPTERLRLCTIVMNSPLYAGKVKFLPSMDNVDGHCEKDVVSVSVEEVFSRSPYLRRHTNLSIDPDRIFDEWVIGCNAVTMDNRFPLQYYISRGYKSNRVFVYKLVDGRQVFR